LKKSTAIFFAFILVFISLSSTTLSLDTVAVAASDEVQLALDSLNESTPRNFRKTSTPIYLTKNEKFSLKGLDKLNISGSQQFSEKNLPILLEEIGTSKPITIVDLRQESHGFINGLPVSWKNLNNDVNKGLTRDEVIEKETNQLSSIPLNSPVTVYRAPNNSMIPTEVFNEDALVTSKNLSYIRIPVTDLGLPTDDMVDYFIEVFKNLPKDSWVHFHCKAGVGRTTTFMIMYDMLINYNEVSATDIIDRQLKLANFDEVTIREFYTPERYKLLLNFYNYCKENGGSFKMSWSKWSKEYDGFISLNKDTGYLKVS